MMILDFVKKYYDSVSDEDTYNTIDNFELMISLFGYTIKKNEYYDGEKDIVNNFFIYKGKIARFYIGFTVPERNDVKFRVFTIQALNDAVSFDLIGGAGIFKSRNIKEVFDIGLKLL